MVRVGRWRAAALLIVGVQVAAFAYLATGARPEPHDLAVGFVGPRVVAQTAADRVDRLPGTTRATDLLYTEAEGREALRDGTLDAVLVIDLRREHDVLLLPASMDRALAADVTRIADAVGASFGRDVEVRQAQVRRNGAAPIWLPYLGVVLALLAGIALAAAPVLRGRVVTTPAAGVRRVAVLAAGAAVAGAVLSLGALPWWEGVWWQVAAASGGVVLSAGLFSLALGSLFGPDGLVAAAVIGILVASPVAARVDPLRLPPPWSWLDGRTIDQAGLVLLRCAAYDQNSGVGRAVATLVVWGAIAGAVLVLTRVLRPPGGEAGPS